MAWKSPADCGALPCGIGQRLDHSKARREARLVGKPVLKDQNRGRGDSGGARADGERERGRDTEQLRAERRR
jgi:hypothetical protein